MQDNEDSNAMSKPNEKYKLIDYIEDNKKNEFERVMESFQSLTEKAVSFNLIDNNNHNSNNTELTQDTITCQSVQRLDVSSNTIDTSVTNISTAISCVEKSENSPSKDNSINGNIHMPKIRFGGSATDESISDKLPGRLLITEGYLVTDFLESFDCYLENCHLDASENWYRILESCIRDRDSRLLNSWFKEKIHENISWTEVKSTIMHTFGFQNPMVEAAVIYFFDQYKPKKIERDFYAYFIIYKYAVKGTRFIEESKFMNPNVNPDDHLIQYFIWNICCKKVSKKIYRFLFQLFMIKKKKNTLPLSADEHCTNKKRYTDVLSWEEFEALIERKLANLLRHESEAIQLEQLQKERRKQNRMKYKEERQKLIQKEKREVKKRKRIEKKLAKKEGQESVPKEIPEVKKRERNDKKLIKEEGQESIPKKIPEVKKCKQNDKKLVKVQEDRLLAKEQTRIAITGLKPGQLSLRKKRNLCIFCGAVEYTFEHHIICKGKERLFKRAKQKEKFIKKAKQKKSLGVNVVKKESLGANVVKEESLGVNVVKEESLGVIVVKEESLSQTENMKLN